MRKIKPFSDLWHGIVWTSVSGLLIAAGVILKVIDPDLTGFDQLFSEGDIIGGAALAALFTVATLTSLLAIVTWLSLWKRTRDAREDAEMEAKLSPQELYFWRASRRSGDELDYLPR